jgi:hypothetical protein
MATLTPILLELYANKIAARANDLLRGEGIAKGKTAKIIDDVRKAFINGCDEADIVREEPLGQ